MLQILDWKFVFNSAKLCRFRFFASQDAQEVMSVSESVRVQIETLLMSPWWLRIPTRDLTDVTLSISDTCGDEEDEEDEI